MNKSAFTLAEVLIALLIIGIVAALTIPQLIQNYKKHVVATRLAKFSAMYQNAIRLAEAENGARNTWDFTLNESKYDEISNTGEICLKRYNKYLRKYIKTVSEKVLPDGVAFALADGSGFIYYYDIQFCVDYKKCLDLIQKSEDSGKFAVKNANFIDGKNVFLLSHNGQPYTWDWDGTRENLLDSTLWSGGCGSNRPLYCAKLIEVSGWKIPDDYPIKF